MSRTWDFLLYVNSAFLLIYSKIYKYSNCKMNYKKKHKRFSVVGLDCY